MTPLTLPVRFHTFWNGYCDELLLPGDGERDPDAGGGGQLAGAGPALLPVHRAAPPAPHAQGSFSSGHCHRETSPTETKPRIN